jgi:4-diphosphocytidyl-2-C-methyl-D-erythritol kinase
MFPRKVGSAWEVCTPAKLNLYLEILNRQDSGYHELETLMVPIRMVDTLHWTPRSSHPGLVPTTRKQRPSWPDPESPGKLNLHVYGNIRRQPNPAMCENVSGLCEGEARLADSYGPTDDNNLVLQAARLIARRAGMQPYGTFTLYKRIPTRAGLGGGSSDAAATLALANSAWKLGYSQAQLLELAAELGSDVPFFIATRHAHGAAICRGRGERVETIGSLGSLHFVLVKPPMGLSTKEIFKQVDLEAIRRQQPLSPAPLQRVIAALRRGALVEACQSMSNRLEAIAMANYDLLRHLREAFKQCLCCGQWMTGSGSAYVGLVRTAKQARHVAGMLRTRQAGTVFTTMSY